MSKNKTKLKGYSFCSLCANTVEVYGIGSCFHPICYRCSTKLRVLMRDKKCPLCEKVLDKVLFTSSLAPEKAFDTTTFIKENEYGIWFETIGIRNMYRNLLFHKCPESNCNKRYINFIDLRNHCSLEHKKFFCSLCLKNENVFTDERQIYSDVARATKGKHQEGEKILETSELWQHSAREHFVCEHSNCIGHPRGIFETEQGLQEHIQAAHAWDSIQRNNISRTPKSLKKDDGKTVSTMHDSLGASRYKSDFKQTNDEIEEEGKIVNISFNFGFIERDGHKGDFSENVFFNNQSCALSFTYDLSETFYEGDRVSFHAKLHPHNNSSKWRATRVTKISENTSKNLNINGNFKQSNSRKQVGKPLKNNSKISNGYKEASQLTGIGFVHCNLGPSYGFIIKEGCIGTNYSENIYFNLKSLQLGLKRRVYDLTKELNINEKVGYELEDLEKASWRPRDLQFRAVKVWKCNVAKLNKELVNGKSASPENDQSQTPRKFEKQQLNVELIDGTSSSDSDHSPAPTGIPSYLSVYGSAINGVDDVYDKPCCSKDVTWDFGLKVDSLYVSRKEFEVFRKILKVIMGRGRNGSIIDFDTELKSSFFTMTQIAYIHFTLENCPKIFSVLMENAPLNDNRKSFLFRGVRGFNADGLQDLMDNHVILKTDDDIYFIEDSAAYIM